MKPKVQTSRITQPPPKPYLNRLALWGDTGCGKDTWLATLQFAGEKSDLSLRPFDEATVVWQAEAWARMAVGDFPRPTVLPQSSAALQFLTFEVADHAASGLFRRQQNLLLQILPVVGAWWPQPHNDPQHGLTSPDPYHHLAYAAGIICLLDPTAPDHTEAAVSLMTMLDYLDLYRRQYKRRHALRIALWLTKMDHPHHRPQKAHAEAYARALFGPRLANFLNTYSCLGGYDLRWGGCSAVGTVIHQGRLRSNTYWDYSGRDHKGAPQPLQRILDPRALQPDGVLEPLRWVMEPMLSGAHRGAASFSPNFDNFRWSSV
jgi:hypothetical protein